MSTAPAPHPADALAVDDLLRLRRRHPCGSHEWRVLRLGAEVGLRCQGCGRRVRLSRAHLRKRLERVLAPVDGTDAGQRAP